MATVNEIREDIANHLRDPEMKRILPYQLLEFINAASHDAKSKGWLIPLEEDESLSLIASTYDYTVPANFAHIHEVWIADASGLYNEDGFVPWNRWWLTMDGAVPVLRFSQEFFTITAGRGIKLVGQARPTEYTATVAGVNEVQRVSHDGTGGTFTLSFGGATTGTIAWNANAAAVTTALEALATIVDVTVTGGALPTAVDVEFVDPGSENVAEMTEDDTNLTGDTIGVTVVTVTQGRVASGTGATDIDEGLESFIRERGTAYAARYMARLMPSQQDVIGEGVVADLGVKYGQLAQEAWMASENLLQEREKQYHLNPRARAVPGR